MSISHAPPTLADADCLGANCNNKGDYWLKIKRLSDIDLGNWGGNEIANGSSQIVSSGKQFCAIAYHPATNSNRRTLDDLQIQVTGPLNPNGSRFVLENGSQKIPVTMAVNPVPNNRPVTPGSPLVPGRWLNISGNDDFQQCRHNELIISVTASRQDIIGTNSAGTYSGQFRMEAVSGDLGSVWLPFQIDLEVSPVIQISGLTDIALTTQGNTATGGQTFCVYALGADEFSIEAESLSGTQEANQKFSLTNGEDRLEYAMTITDQNATSKNFFKNNHKPKDEFTPTDDYLCSLQENMALTISVNAISGSSGVYTDTMKLVVRPE